MSESDYYCMVDGWHLKDQKEWQKFRLVASYSIAGHLKKPLPLDKIIKLPLIDGKVDDRVNENIQYLLELKRQAQEKRKSPAAE